MRFPSALKRELPQWVGDGLLEQRQADHQHAGHRARLEGNVESATEALLGGMGGAHIGPHRNIHADESGYAGQYRAEDKPDGDRDA